MKYLILTLSILGFFERAYGFCLQNFNAYGPIYAAQVSERADSASRQLEQDGCDVIHLQEVWNQSTISIFEKNLQHRYAISAPNKKSRIGVMTLSEATPQGEQTYSFRVNNDAGILDGVRDLANVKKAFHLVKIPIEGQLVWLLNTHLHPSSTAVRVTQVVDLFSWRMGNSQEDLFISGDFNADFDSVEIQLLKALLKVRDGGLDFFGGQYPPGYCTYCAENPRGWLWKDKVFDYIFVGEGSEQNHQWYVIDFEVNMKGSKKKPLSDHYGLKAKFAKKSRESSEKAINQNLKLLAVALLKAENALLAERRQDLKEYLNFLRTVRGQILNGSGPYYDYFAK